ncbi:futalosine hydrolase [Deinococcus puniceus]|uniref:Futalosine hydrolase n=1 Tax=Deinococcus puniceus TaxID=1182568 RepID=A0A172T7Y0_9DEIO|nr:futalosine hydrolase [Deinococcus puniceus]ANE43090.1 futalosine nucleosidase [Deinococcus puniceus]
MKVLIIVATAGEAARLAGVPAHVVVCGVGAVAAALTTQQELMQEPYDLAVSAGIGGAYPGSGLNPGDLAVSSLMAQADLGAVDGLPGQETFLSLEELGLSVQPDQPSDQPNGGIFPAWQGAQALAERLQHSGGQQSGLRVGYGPALTLSTVTGNVAVAHALAARFPGAMCEGMEGAGVAHAALRWGVPALEIRGISNPVGPRDRASWKLGEALAATRRGVEGLLGW